jgi:hypothetical protein
MDEARRILDILDDCAKAFYFPALDNGYVYLAASRLSLYRSAQDWALAFEIFGFSPRSGHPDIGVWTYASRLHERNGPEKYRDAAAYTNYLNVHPHDDARFFFPCDDQWIGDAEDVHAEADHLLLRGERIELPPRSAYAEHGIELQSSDEIRVFELCRWLAATHRDGVLASESERRCSVLPEMQLLLTLDDWRHADITGDEKPGDTETFRQLAEVLVTGDLARYRPSLPSNTHWKLWPMGGTL